MRKIRKDELRQLLRLYSFLHDDEQTVDEENAREVFSAILSDPNHHIIVAEEDGKIVASCVVVLVLNLTRGLRPYAIVENVVTDPAYRRRGMARACLDFARDIAKSEGCYKMLLQTSSKNESIHRFYESAGYNSADKTGFVQWFDFDRK